MMTMKKNICLIAGVVLVLTVASACQDSREEEIPLPQIALAEVSAGTEENVFTISAVDADELAYVCIEASGEIPSVEHILSTGTPVEPSESAEVTVSSLTPGTDYIVAAAASNSTGAVTEPATLSVSTVSEFFADIESASENTDIWYYGVYAEGVDQFMIQLSSGLVGDDAMPLEGGSLIRLFVFANATDGDNPVLEAGTYTLGGNTVGSIWAEGSQFATGTTADASQWSTSLFSSGEVSVALENGVYTIEANLVLDDGNGSKVRGRASGEIRIEDLTDGFRHFYDDVEPQTMTGMGGYVMTSSSGLDSYTFTMYNTPVDEGGFVAGAGYVAGLTLYAPALPAGETDFTGTYSINPDYADGVYPEYTFIPGYLYMGLPYGTYMAEYNDEGAIEAAGLVTGGTVTIQSASDGVSVSADLITSTGAHISLTYSGAYLLTDYR